MSKTKDKALRKNITLSPDAERALVKLSKIFGKPQSKIVESLIKEKAKSLEKNEKIDALRSMKGLFRGMFKEKKVQTIKSEMKSD